MWFRVFDEPSERIIKERDAVYKILKMHQEDQLEIVGSVFLDDEIDTTGDKGKKEAVSKFIYKFVNEKIDYIPKTYSIIMDKTELTVKDSVHIACAAEGKAIFITVDDEIVKKRKTIAKLGVRVVNPVEFVEGF